MPAPFADSVSRLFATNNSLHRIVPVRRRFLTQARFIETVNLEIGTKTTTMPQGSPFQVKEKQRTDMLNQKLLDHIVKFARSHS